MNRKFFLKITIVMVSVFGAGCGEHNNIAREGESPIHDTFRDWRPAMSSIAIDTTDRPGK